MKASQTNHLSFRHSRRGAYLLALGLTALTLLVRVIIGSRFEGPTMIVFTIPIILSAYWGGLGPGLLTTMLSALGAAYYVLPPIFSFNVLSTTQRWQEVMLILTGGLISVICELSHRAHGRVEKLLAERQCDEAEVARLAAIVASSDDAIIGKNLDGIITSWNAGAEKIFGYPAQEMVGQSILRLIPSERRQEESEILNHVRRGESTRHFETVRLRKDGKLIDVSVTTSAIRNASGKIIGASKVARDITERKQMEDARRASEARYRTLFDYAPDGIVVVDAKGYYRDVNASICRMLGYTRDEFIGLNATDIVAPAEIPHIGQALDVIKTKSDYQREWQFRRKDGSVFAVDTIATAMPDGNLLAMIRDITERKQVEDTLRESRAKLEAALASMTDAVFISDETGKFIEINDAFATFHRFKNKVECARTFAEYPDLLEVSMADGTLAPVDMWAVPRALRGETVTNAEYHLRRKDTGETWVGSYSFSPIRDKDGTIVGSVVVGRDITERKEMELALRDSEEKFRTMANSITQLAWIARADGFIFWYNQRWYEYTGTTPEQMEGWGWQSVPDPEALPKVMESWKGAIDAGKPFEMEFPLRGADGKFRAFLTRAQPLKDSEGRVVQWFGTNTDVETLKKAEEQIHQLNVELEQRVNERTAQLAAANKELEAFSYSVSHDLRAPLRAMNGFAGIVLEEFSSLLPKEGKRHLERIRDGGQRMGELIDDLLAFSHLSRQSVNRQIVDMVKLAQSVLDELKPLLDGRRIEIKVGELPTCHGDRALLKQVWVNLLSNAVKYTRGREPAIIEIGCALENNESVYFVRDNGAGFDMRYANKLFGVFQRLHRSDEFEGTGVGLAIVQRIVHRHGGRVWAEAELNHGATFYFTLERENKL